MRVGALFPVVLLLAVGIAHSEDVALAEGECKTTCNIVQQNNKDGTGSWLISMDYGVMYFYLYQQNAFIIYNININIITVIDGNSGTTTILNPDTGYGYIINLITSQTYLIYQNLQTFDLSVMQENNYQIMITIYEYTSQFITYVTGTQDSNGIYFSIDIMLKYIYEGAKIEQWEQIFQGNTEVMQQFKVNFEAYIYTVYQLYVKYSYTLESGSSIFIASITQIESVHKDVFVTNIAQFAIFIVQTMYGKISNSLMQQYYLLFTTNDDADYVTQQFQYLTWAIIGIGSTYQTLDEALYAYAHKLVVQTHVSIITDAEKNQYLAYNSMVNGTWVFKIMYTSRNSVMITSSYTDQYLGIYDPKLDYVLVYTEGNNFGFINYKTGNGLVINGTNNQAVYAQFQSEETVNYFKKSQIRDGFRVLAGLVKATDNTGSNSFDLQVVLTGIREGKELSTLLTNDEIRGHFEQDFSVLIESLKTYGEDQTTNLVSYMLVNTQSSFFQSGFVEMTNNMFKFRIATPRFYIDIYAGILYSIETKWSEPLFKNVNNLLDDIPTNNQPAEVIQFVEMYMQLKWRITVSSPRYYIDGSAHL